MLGAVAPGAGFQPRSNNRRCPTRSPQAPAGRVRCGCRRDKSNLKLDAVLASVVE